MAVIKDLLLLAVPLALSLSASSRQACRRAVRSWLGQLTTNGLAGLIATTKIPWDAGQGVLDSGRPDAASYTVGQHMNKKFINRNTKTITFSLPPEMAEQVQDVMREEGRTMSELIRDALRNYMEEREWLRTMRYERLRARHTEQEDSRRKT